MTSELYQFRMETRAWLEQNCPAEMRQPLRGEEDICWGGRRFAPTSAAQKTWLDRMAARGWTVPHWPAAYGGGGLLPGQVIVLREEMARIRARDPLRSLGITMLGPALLHFGTEAQKREHLPGIARGEIRWCQGYSEPNAGSDLASLTTSADDAGDHFIVNGQKTWTSYGDQADWMFCLVRTDRANKHRGISFVLFDMASPGITTRPIMLISGYSAFCETFLDNVPVMKSNLVGELNRGWDVAKYLLTHERGSISDRGLGQDEGTSLSAQAIAQFGLDSKGRLNEPILRAEIAMLEARELAFLAMTERNRDEVNDGRAHPAQPSMMKYYGTELNKARHELSMSVGGIDALEWESERSQQGLVPRAWLRSKANSILGGTNEIQLNIIAKRILELPGS